MDTRSRGGHREQARGADINLGGHHKPSVIVGRCPQYCGIYYGMGSDDTRLPDMSAGDDSEKETMRTGDY